MGSETYYDLVQEIARTAKEVPPEFVSTEEVQKTVREAEEDQKDALQIPLIDLRPLLDPATGEELRASVIEEIGQACEDWGFLQVVNHGIPEALLDKTVEVVEGFFNSPVEEKIVYLPKPGTFEGYGKFGRPPVRPWVDNFRHVTRPRPAPGQDAAPKIPAEYREVMHEYEGEVVALARRLTDALSDYFDLEAGAFRKGLAKDLDDYPGFAFVLNYQPKCPEPERVLAILPHSDSGALTVVHHNQVKGLQVLRGEKWVGVKPLKNALVVNVGNQLWVSKTLNPKPSVTMLFKSKPGLLDCSLQ